MGEDEEALAELPLMVCVWVWGAHKENVIGPVDGIKIKRLNKITKVNNLIIYFKKILLTSPISLDGLTLMNFFIFNFSLFF